MLGHPVAHSLSPSFQTAALRACGLDLTYEAVDVAPEALGETVRRLVAEGAAGNVTVPYKETIVRLCDRLTPTAQRVGAVNAFWSEDDRLVGDNTDVGGFTATTIAFHGTPKGRVTVLGAGGAAAAVLAAATEWPGVEARVWNRTAARAVQLAERFGATALGRIGDAVEGAELVVNATSIGLDGTEQPVSVAMLPRGADVIDLVYSPNETPWVHAARAAGHRAIDGLAMLIEQGALAFECWFGTSPDRAAMWRAAAPDRNRFTTTA